VLKMWSGSSFCRQLTRQYLSKRTILKTDISTRSVLFFEMYLDVAYPQCAAARCCALRLPKNRGSLRASPHTPGQVLPVDEVIPPSTTIFCPVIYFASSETRNRVVLATSHASPIFPVGTCASLVFIYSS